MKIGIITYHFSDNFGAALQAYALRAWLKSKRCEAEFVNYCPAYVEHGGGFVARLSKDALRANLKIAYLRVCAMKRKHLGNRRQQDSFVAFRALDLGVNAPPLKCIEELRDAATDYQLLICGSDQIWNPSVQRGLDPAYFLRFGPPSVRRISYAASFGGATLDILRAAGAGALLSGLDSIATREESGVRHVSDLIGREAECVLDPTLLWEDYNCLVKDGSERARSRYVFCYALRTDEGVRGAAQRVASSEKLQIVTPQNPHGRWRPIGETVYPGPREWVSLVANSSCVVTNSFHGTAFSIIMRRPFVVVGLPEKKRGLNDRMLSLLRKLGLEHRFLVDESQEDVRKIMNQPIDWATVEERLHGWRRLSQRYLLREIDLAAKYGR